MSDDGFKESTSKRPQFGQRYLSSDDDVFRHNAWDEVEWTEDQEADAIAKVKEQTMCLMDNDKKDSLLSTPHSYWDAFYNVHTNRFFKDRHWLFTEFPELLAEQDLKESTPERKVKNTANTAETDNEVKCDGAIKITGQKALLEIGCGVGNTVIPILEYAKDHPSLHVYCCDFSETAINILKQHPSYDSERATAFVADVTKENWESPFSENSLDAIIVVFVLSAIHPDKFKAVVSSMYKYLKPGGLVVFRDFGRYDMVQMRFKKGRCLQDNLYARGDGTLAYFFTQDEVRTLFTSHGFTEEQNLVDRRLLVNRGQKLKMYRVWVQCKYRKPL